MTPNEKSQHMSIAAHTRWSREPDRTAATAKARAAAEKRFELLVDPDGVLTDSERMKRAESARKAHFARMAIASAKARRKRA